MPAGRSAVTSAGVWAGVERTGTHKPPRRPSVGHTSPWRLCLGVPTSVPSCHLLPSRRGRWGNTGRRDEGRAHQSPPTERTTFRMRLTPHRTRALPLQQRGPLHRPLAQLLPADRQRRPPRVGIQAPAAHQDGSGGWHMEPPTPDERLPRQAHRPTFRRGPGAFGPLLIPQDSLLTISCEKSPIGNRPTAQVPRSVDQAPLPIGIALADVHMPLGAAELVQQVAHLLSTLPRGNSALPLVQPLADGGQEFAPKDRHDHPHRQ